MKNADKPHPFYTAFYNDTQKIIDRVYFDNPDICDIVCKGIAIGEEMEWKVKIGNVLLLRHY